MPDQVRHDETGLLKTALALVAAFLFMLLAIPAHAQTFPAFTGLVTDAANILPADRKAALEQQLEAFQQQTGRQLVVATIPDLQGYAIEDYGYRLGRNWGVGLKGADNGAILIVAPNERKVRIEVGYRLEPVLTDAFSSLIVQTKIVPAFKAGDMPGGIAAGADAMIQQLGLPDDQARAQIAKAAAAFDESHKGHEGHDGSGFPFGLIFWLVIVGVIMASHFGRRRAGPWGARRYTGGGGNWPIWLWAASELAQGSR
ncbi:TPM domain-containing protein, partial [Sphingomonas bacterium]|uniref:TPM domain-containing protein n=1 Tax=Sphingomonas bacterium TaxID=1895847 RepID=UPI0020C712B3